MLRVYMFDRAVLIIIPRGGFSHVLHVRPNRGPHKKGPHMPEIVGRMQKATLNSDNSSNIAYSSHVSSECFCTLMSENLCEGAHHIFTEQGPIGFKSGPGYTPSLKCLPQKGLRVHNSVTSIKLLNDFNDR